MGTGITSPLRQVGDPLLTERDILPFSFPPLTRGGEPINRLGGV